ncbi:hypothetical protein D3C78_1553490 [compost metagenome]
MNDCHQASIENRFQLALWRMFIQYFNVTGHGLRDGQGEPRFVARDMADQIPFVDDADDLAVLQHRQL